MRALDPNDDVGTTQVITPNDDGKNEVLFFPYLDQYPDASIVVFNRWGAPVFTEAPYQNQWDGTYNGHSLPAGTYYYVLNCTATII